jgi:hypothetical protein
MGGAQLKKELEASPETLFGVPPSGGQTTRNPIDRNPLCRGKARAGISPLFY